MKRLRNKISTYAQLEIHSQTACTMLNLSNIHFNWLVQAFKKITANVIIRIMFGYVILIRKERRGNGGNERWRNGWKLIFLPNQSKSICCWKEKICKVSYFYPSNHLPLHLPPLPLLSKRKISLPSISVYPNTPFDDG